MRVRQKRYAVSTTKFSPGPAQPAPCVIDAAGIAVEAGSILAQNIVMLGAASHFILLAADTIVSAVRASVPPKTVEINVRAFDMGRDAVRGCGT